MAVDIPQTTAGPEILPVNKGGVADRLRLRAPGLVPQALVSVTEIEPIVNPIAGTTVIAVVPWPET